MPTDRARRRAKKKAGEGSVAHSSAAQEPTAASLTAPSKASFWRVLRQATQPNARWTKRSFPELYEVVFWLRVGAGVLCGVVCGAVPVTGSLGVVAFPTLTVAGVSAYYSYFLGVDEDDFGPGELLKEGMAVSIVLYLLAWIMTYTSLYGGRG